jgi:hypothetical protein
MIPTLPRFGRMCHGIKAHCGQIWNLDASLLQHCTFRVVYRRTPERPQLRPALIHINLLSPVGLYDAERFLSLATGSGHVPSHFPETFPQSNDRFFLGDDNRFARESANQLGLS